jgi:flavin reductase (DIM6/NTAB) family NADH-FMN oxidoreductase RutF
VPERHFYRPGEHRPAFAHDPFNAIVGPRPIGWISSLSPGGVANLAPYSFFNAFCYTPPIIGFASNGWKHSVANIEAAGEFGWNLAAEPLGEAMNWTSTVVEADVDEFTLAGLAKAQGRHIAAPLVAAAPVSFECKLSQIVRLRSAAGEATDSWMVFGEVVGVHVDLAMVRDGVFDPALARPLLRAGGPADYFAIREENRLRMVRPTVEAALAHLTEREAGKTAR